MKKIKPLWMAMLTLMLPALQSCDDNDGYSLGDIAVAAGQRVPQRSAFSE